jgi:hypothetical protein
MVCRLGTSELTAVFRYSQFMKGKRPYDAKDYAGLDVAAGFFPVNAESVGRYYHRMVDDFSYIDVLGSWLREELYFRNELKKAVRCPLEDLEPYYHPNPWSEALEGKRVLVVHPFAATIERQYQFRESLFSDNRILPKFDLATIRAVQSIGTTGGRAQFSDWFSALDYMEQAIAKTTFDVAIIGCGAYGLPLAAHVKRLGKVAVHLGGATQVLFGIRGQRWDSIPKISAFFNSFWTRPDETDRPENYQQIEGGCYW